MSGSVSPEAALATAGRRAVSWVTDRAASESAPVWTAWIATASANTTASRENTSPILDQRMVRRSAGRRYRSAKSRTVAAPIASARRGSSPPSSASTHRAAAMPPRSGSPSRTRPSRASSSATTTATINGRPAENGLTPETFTSSTTSVAASRAG